MAHRDDPRERYKKELDRLDLVVDGPPTDTDGPGKLRGNISQTDADAIRELLDALNPDRPGTVFQANGNGTETKEYKTLCNYVTRLRLAATEADEDLLDQDTDSINDLMGRLSTGEAEIAPTNGYSKGTIGQYQSALKAFYRYHDRHGVDPEAIPVFASDPTTVDDRDMFTVDEVQAMRDAIESPRERCIFELLAYTGQRIRVIQTLRIKDIDLDAGMLYINENENGLKGAKGKRPLLGAKEYVRQWLEYHPTKEPEDYLITPSATGGGTPGDTLTQDAIRYHLNKIADKAGVTKDVNPHVFRHYFTTIAKRDYGLDDAYIKHLRGDAPGSNVMETTYRHLSDDDAAEHATAKFEGREPETESPMSPEVCPTCGEILKAGARACDRCGAVFTVDAQSAQDQIKSDMKASYKQVDPADEETMAQLDTLDALIEERLGEKLEDPEFLEQALAQSGED